MLILYGLGFPDPVQMGLESELVCLALTFCAHALRNEAALVTCVRGHGCKVLYHCIIWAVPVNMKMDIQAAPHSCVYQQVIEDETAKRAGGIAQASWQSYMDSQIRRTARN